MADFKQAYSKTMGIEGGYSNDPDDIGGETYKGISRVYNPSWHGWIIIDNLKEDILFPKILDDNKELQKSVKDFYKDKYWDVNMLDSIPQAIANEMFDTGVNLGTSRAAKFLQRSLSYLNRNKKLFPDLVDDGKVGKNTMTALNIIIKLNEQTLLLKIMNVQQGQHYLEYMKKSPTQEKYARGWFSRVEY